MKSIRLFWFWCDHHWLVEILEDLLMFVCVVCVVCVVCLFVCVVCVVCVVCLFVCMYGVINDLQRLDDVEEPCCSCVMWCLLWCLWLL